MMLPLPAPPLTLDVRAMPLTRALPLLGERYGTPMRASPAIGSETVILSLRNAELPALRERLAAAFAGGWSVDPDGTLVFGVDAKARAKEERAVLARRVAAIEAGLAKLRAEVKSAPAFDANARRRQVDEVGEGDDIQIGESGGSTALPGVRAGRRIMASLRAADLPLGAVPARVVFSTLPTRMQMAFPSELAPIFRDWLAEEAAWRATGKSGDPLVFPKVVTMTVSAWPTFVRCEFEGYDGAGKEIFASDERIDFAPATGTYAPDPRLKGRTVELRLSPEAAAFARAFAWRAEDRGPREGAARFLDVVARDPMSYEVSEMAFAIGKAMGRSLVMASEDFPPTLTPFLKDGVLKVPLDTSALGADLSLEGWAVMRPELPPDARRDRYPRVALARALRTVYANPAPDLPTLAGIAATAPEGAGGYWAVPPLWNLVAMLSQDRGFGERGMLALFDAVGPRAFGEGGVRLGDLPADLRARAARLVFGPYAAAFQNEGASDAQGEVTTALANGIPPDARLMSLATPDLRFRVAGKEGAAPYDYTLPTFAAALRALQGGKSSGGLDFGRIRLVDRTVHRLGIAYGENAYGEKMGTWATVEIPSSARPETFSPETLPAPLRALVQRTMAEQDAAERGRTGREERAGRTQGGGELPR